MSNALLAETRPLCNAFKSSGNPSCSSFLRVVIESLSSKQCTRSVHQKAQCTARCSNQRHEPLQRHLSSLSRSRNVGVSITNRPSSSRLLTTSTPNAYIRDRHAARAPPRSGRPSGSIPLWEQYSPSVGVPLHGGRLPARAINSIFDKALDVEDGNLLLRRLQHRRLSGALAHEPLDYFPESSVSSPSELAGLGLKYLREKFPMDEQRQADAYAEREVNKAEKQLIQRAQRMGIYKSDDASESSTSDASSDPGPLYGESVLERVRKANEARRREREAREAREAQAAQEAEAQAPVTASATASSSSSTALDTPRKRPAWVAKWAERATLSTAPEAPTLSLTRRIFPSLMLLLAIVGGCVLYTSTYTPPARANRLLPDTPTALATIGALIGANAAVFVAWRLPPLWPLLNRYAVLVPGQPYAASLLGNVFSHQKGAHLLLNMGMLALLGTRLHEGIGRAAFLSVFLCSGAAGGLASLVYYTLTRNFTTSSFGASGAVAGILAAVCLVDGARVMGFGKGGEEKGWLESLLVLPGWTLLGAMVAADVVGMRTRRQPVDHVAHLGGYAAGALGALVINWKMGQKEKEKGKGEDGVAMERVEAEKRDGPNVNKSK